MSVIPLEKLEKLVQRWELVQEELNQGASDPDKFARLSREFADLDPVVSAIGALQKGESERAELMDMIADTSSDKEMSELARAELSELEPRLEQMRQDLHTAFAQGCGGRQKCDTGNTCRHGR